MCHAMGEFARELLLSPVPSARNEKVIGDPENGYGPGGYTPFQSPTTEQDPAVASAGVDTTTQRGMTTMMRETSARRME